MTLPLSELEGLVALILLGALALPFLAEKLKLPPHIGLILAAMIIGSSGILPQEPGAGLEFLGRLGLVYVFFSAATRLDFHALRSHPRDSIFGSILFLGFPFLLAASALVILPGAETAPALLVGSLFSVYSLLSYPEAERLGIQRQPAVRSAAGVQLLVNTGAMLLFTLSLWRNDAAHGPDRFSSVLVPAALALLFPLAAALLLKKIKFGGNLEFVLVLASAFICAYAARLSGLSSAAGAFFSGMVIRHFAPADSGLMRRIRFAEETIFLPFFMIYAAVLADPLRALVEPASLQAILVVCLVGLGSSLLGCLGSSLLGMRYEERLVMFGLGVNRCAMGLGMVVIAYTNGLVGRELLDAFFFLMLASGITGSLMTRRAGRLLALRAKGPREGPAAEERILIAISNPLSIKNLVELAFLLRGQDNNEPVYPVAILPASAEGRAEIAVAENKLTQAVVQGVAAGVPVVPAAKLSVNVPEGILQAAEENKVGIIVIGWNKAPRLSHAFFGSLIEQVILGGRQLVVVARVSRSLASLSRIVLVLPPLAYRHPGFPRALALISSLLLKTGARIRIFTLGSHGAAARAALAKCGGRIPMQIEELDSWQELCPAARREREADASLRGFALLTARPGESSWHPALEKIPHAIGSEFPGSPLFIMYLPSAAASSEQKIEAEQRSPGQVEAQPDLFDLALRAGRVRPAMRESAITDGIRELLGSAFAHDRRVLGRLTGLFTEMAQKRPVELEPGVLLLHAQVHEVEQPLVFFGARSEGFPLLALESPVRILVILCAPQGQAPEDHLMVLGQIARLFRDGSLAARLGIPKTLP